MMAGGKLRQIPISARRSGRCASGNGAARHDYLRPTVKDKCHADVPMPARSAAGDARELYSDATHRSAALQGTCATLSLPAP